MPALLEATGKDGFEFDMMDTSFFVSRETLIATVAAGHGALARAAVRVDVEDGGQGDRLLPHPDQPRRRARYAGRAVARAGTGDARRISRAMARQRSARKTPATAGVSVCPPRRPGLRARAICARIDFSALLSIWRMRSADTPYSSARSCSVAGSSSRSQRASMMRRLRSSSFASARLRPVGAVRRGLGALEDLHRLVLGVGEVGDRRHGVAVVVRLRVERDVAAGEARLHLDDFLGLDAEVLRDRPRLLVDERGRARLHPAQVEEELALRLGRGDLDQPPVAQDVLVDLGPDPVQRERHQAHAALGVEAAHGLHQADVAFLDEVGLRQPVAQVLAADGDDQAQVRQHELLRGVEVVVAGQPAAELDLLLGGEQRKAVHRLDVVIQAAQRGRGREGQRGSGHGVRLLRRRAECGARPSACFCSRF